MKRIFLIAGTAILLGACKDAPKADNVEATEAQTVTTESTGTTYNANVTASKVEWVGTKPVGRHHGTVKIKQGSLTVAGTNVTGGSFVLDMTTIQPDDQDAEGNEKLGGHLKSADFFEVDKHPEAMFEITSISAGVDANNKDLVMKDATHTVTGNLTLKGISKSITFPAKISVSETQVVADANFNIDRTQWGIRYRDDKGLGDKFIDHEMNIQLHLVANK
jgi:polyisoprenoid-binding protein YceI